MSQKVTAIHCFVKVGSISDAYEEHFHYRFQYFKPEHGIAFYLSSIQKIFSNGEAEPEKRLTYHLASEVLKTTHWKVNSKLSPWIQQIGTGIIQPMGGSLVDLDSEGLSSIEIPLKDFALLKQDSEKFELEPLPAATAEVDRGCRFQFAGRPVPRRLMKLRGPQGPLEVVYFAYLQNERKTNIVTCSREGVRTGSVKVNGDWEIDPNTTLADFSRKGTPDVLKIYRNQYAILRNLSTADHLKFSTETLYGKLNSASYADGPLTIFVQDMNGDGIPDIIGYYRTGFVVWYGKGDYSFDIEGRKTFELRDKTGRKLPFNPELKAVFHDLDGDGISDLILFGKNHINVYLTDGENFIREEVPALSAFPFNLDSNPIVIPAIGDFSGSGNVQLTVADRSAAYFIEFTHPETGFLTAADDGKGNHISFFYGRANPEKRIGTRVPVLKSMKVKTTGKEEKTYHYEFDHVKTHSLMQSLLGFDHVTVKTKFDHRESDFFHEDQIPSLLLTEREFDSRQPNVYQVERREYDKATFQGLNYRRLKKEIVGSADEKWNQTVLSEKSYLEYQDELCPSLIEEKLEGSVVKIANHNEKPPALKDHLGCFLSHETLSEFM